MGSLVTTDGNGAAARIAYRLSDVIAIYPNTPASPMGEPADTWAAAGTPNLWGTVPRVVEVQSEAGAAGVLHGALTTAVIHNFNADGIDFLYPRYKGGRPLVCSVRRSAGRSSASPCRGPWTMTCRSPLGASPSWPTSSWPRVGLPPGE